MIERHDDHDHAADDVDGFEASTLRSGFRTRIDVRRLGDHFWQTVPDVFRKRLSAHCARSALMRFIEHRLAVRALRDNRHRPPLVLTRVARSGHLRLRLPMGEYIKFVLHWPSCKMSGLNQRKRPNESSRISTLGDEGVWLRSSLSPLWCSPELNRDWIESNRPIAGDQTLRKPGTLDLRFLRSLRNHHGC